MPLMLVSNILKAPFITGFLDLRVMDGSPQEMAVISKPVVYIDQSVSLVSKLWALQVAR